MGTKYKVFLRRTLGMLFALTIAFSVSFGCIIPARAAAAATSGTSGSSTPEASSGNSLKSDSTQSTQAEALGFSTSQPARYAPNGKEVDKSKNPLGSNNLTMSRIYQLGITYGNMTNVYNNPLGTTRMFNGNAASTIPYLNRSNPMADGNPTAWGNAPGWSTAERACASADVDGNGTLEMITAGYFPIGTDGKNVSIHLLVSDYSSLDTSESRKTRPTAKDYTVVASISNPSDRTNYDQSLQITAGDYNHDGKDEIAVAAGTTLYIFKADLTSCTQLSTTSFSGGAISFRSIKDLETADANGDGFVELLVAVKTGISDSVLYIYGGADLTKRSAQISLKFLDSDGKTERDFTNPSVTVGDAFGNGNKYILVGGTVSGSNVAIGYASFHPDTETYDRSLTAAYSLTYSDFGAVKGNMGIKCVSLATPVGGTPGYVVLGGFIFKYDSATDAFVRQDIATYTNSSDLKGNKTDVSLGNITDTNTKKDDTYILNTLVGNFDGNTLGQEQIIMLHYNKWYDSEYVYVTTCGMSGDGTINARLQEVWKKGDVAYNNPAICAAGVLNNGVRLEFESEKSTFAFSNPNVIAVLGATPYYKELEDKYGALGNVGTTYGTSSESSSSTSNGMNAHVGVSFGFTQEVAVLGVKIGGSSIDTTITNSFSYTWTNSKSVSKSLSFTGYYSDDSVVLMVTPYDIYYYKVYVYDSTKNTIVQSEMSINVPYAPMTTIMPLTDYNKAAASIKNAPVIGSEVLKHTVGDPRSYPQSSKGLSNVSGKDVLTGGTSTNEIENFVAAGTGNNSVEQSIDTSTTKEKAFDYSLDMNIAFNSNLFGVTFGASWGGGYTRNATTSSTSATERTGCVASVPYDKYNFNWCLVAYNYNLKAGSSTQECTVISYLVKPVSTFPPAVPANFKLKSQTPGSVVLQWDQAKNAAGYKITRSETEGGTYSNLATLTGLSTTTYTDTTAASGKTYYYAIIATAAVDAIPSAPLEVSIITVSSITVKTQPAISYTEGDKLSLGDMVVSMKYSDNTSADVPFKSFATNNLTTSIADGTSLTVSQTGIPITVTYTTTGLTANTSNITVNAKSSYDLTMTVAFKVGSVNNATALSPNSTLNAAITLKNNTNSSQQVIVILALYNEKGTMTSYTFKNQAINASSTINLNQQLSLPANVAGYTAKVFVWDGKDLQTSTLTPKSNTAQISA